MAIRPCSNYRAVLCWTSPRPSLSKPLPLIKSYAVNPGLPKIDLSSEMLPEVASALSRPTWSVRSLLSEKPATWCDGPGDIKPSQLAHLLRLSALPQPRDGDEEKEIRDSLQSQLFFVRCIQAVDTTGVEPLAAIRDETSEGRAEGTIGLQQLQGVLDAEDKIGKFERPRRRKPEGLDVAGSEVRQGWDPLKTASKVNGRYIVVRTGGRMEHS